MAYKKTPMKFIRVFYRIQRGAVRVLTIPFRGLKEGGFKTSLRKTILTMQHSLPTEFVVNKGDVVVQVGTPRPRTMRRFLRAIGPAGKLIIVEAMPENQDRLAAAISEGGITNVLLLRGAASNQNGIGELLISPYQGDHKIDVENVVMDNEFKPGNDYKERVSVKFFKLDDELPRNGIHKIGYISITVNGAEAEVLRGASELLKKCDHGTRVYAKGHALDADKNPIHLLTQSIMISNGYETKITRGEPSSTRNTAWLWRAGDLYAWKT